MYRACVLGYIFTHGVGAISRSAKVRIPRFQENENEDEHIITGISDDKLNGFYDNGL